MKKYKFHIDPGHAWLAVKRKELENMGILHTISAYSYQRGETVYLEEDDDFHKFKKAKENLGQVVHVDESYQNYSPIRSYERFTA